MLSNIDSVAHFGCNNYLVFAFLNYEHLYLIEAEIRHIIKWPLLLNYLMECLREESCRVDTVLHIPVELSLPMTSLCDIP